MNGKTAKALRRQARIMTPNLPNVEYRGKETQKKGKTKEGKEVSYISTTVVLGDCTRRVYKNLKQGFKNGTVRFLPGGKQHNPAGDSGAGAV